MKTKTNIAKLSLSFLILFTMTFSLVFLSSCEKTDETLDLTTDNELEAVMQQTFAAELFDEIIEIGEEAEAAATTKSTEEVAGPFFRLSECVDISREFFEGSRTITIDFGEENCEGADGKFRRGKIIIIRSGFYWHSEVTATYTFENYFVDDNQVIGTKSYTGAFNDDGTYSSSFTAEGEIILADDAGTITWNSTRNYYISEGADTRGFADNRVEVTGFSNGVTSGGDTFSSEIIEPLIRIYEEGCFRHYVSGITEILHADGTVITINYGDGTCDNLAEVTTNGVTVIIELGNARCGSRRR